MLQAEVTPYLLIKDRRKFHVRTYVSVIEMLHLPEMLDIFLYKRHEIRMAGVPVQDESGERDRLAHITNAALSQTTECVLLHQVPELMQRGLQEKIETFVAEVFGQHFLPDIQRRVSQAARTDSIVPPHRKFAVAGLDLMVTEDNRIYLLEVNVNPSVPPENTLADEFKDHLQGFLRDLVDLVVGRPSPNFVSCSSLLPQG